MPACSNTVGFKFYLLSEVPITTYLIFFFRNSLSLDMMNDLTEAINRNKDDVTLRAIIISAKGNVFSAGHNLKELVSYKMRNTYKPLQIFNSC